MSSIISLKHSPASPFDFDGCRLINYVSVKSCVHLFLFGDLDLENSVSAYINVLKRLVLYSQKMSVLYWQVIGWTACQSPIYIIFLSICYTQLSLIPYLCADDFGLVLKCLSFVVIAEMKVFLSLLRLSDSLVQ